MAPGGDRERIDQPPAETVARLDAVAASLVERALPTVIRRAHGAVEIETAQRLRGHAMLGQGWARPDDLVDGREVDAYDERAVHLLAFQEGVPIGTCRLVPPQAGRPLPVETIPGVPRIPGIAVELGRVVVRAPTAAEGRRVLAGLVGQAWLEMRAAGLWRICGLASDAMLRLYRRLGFDLVVLGPAVTNMGDERFPIVFEPLVAVASIAARHEASAPPAIDP